MTRESQPLPIHILIPSVESTHRSIFNTTVQITLQANKNIEQYFKHHSTKRFRTSYAKITKAIIHYNGKSHTTIIFLYYSVYNRYDGQY